MFKFSRNKERLLSDDDLIKKYQGSGDMQLLGELYHRHMHMVYGVCVKYLQDREQSKDAVMEIFEKLLQGSINQKIENFPAWLYVVTRNYCLMQLRKTQRNQEIEPEEIYFPENFMENPVDVHLNNETNTEELILKKCMAQLPDKQRQCIELFYFKEKCYKEIAKITAYELKQVKSYIQNGKRNLKTCLENNDA